MAGYNKRILEYFQHPKFSGKITNPSGVGIKGNMKCGDEMKIYIKVKDNIITDIRYHTFGCVAAISSSEALCRLAKGKKVSEAMKISNKDIVEELGGEMPVEKYHCSVLGAEALHSAIEDYKKKK